MCLAPKARCYISLGHRPRIATASETSAESATQGIASLSIPYIALVELDAMPAPGMNRAFSAGTFGVYSFLGRCPQAVMNAAPLALNTCATPLAAQTGSLCSDSCEEDRQLGTHGLKR